MYYVVMQIALHIYRTFNILYRMFQHNLILIINNKVFLSVHKNKKNKSKILKYKHYNFDTFIINFFIVCCSKNASSCTTPTSTPQNIKFGKKNIYVTFILYEYLHILNILIQLYMYF